MLYGIKMEPIELIVSIRQSFLASSPDSSIGNNSMLELLEIKCPSSCKDNQTINVKKELCQIVNI